jgi:hypothetical protein
MLSHYTQIFLAPAEEVLIYPLKPLQEYLQFPCEYFLLVFRSRVAVVNFVPQPTREENITRIKIGRT